MEGSLAVILIGLLLVFVSVAVVLVHKARRVHLALYQMGADAAEARRESTAIFGQIQAFVALDRLLGMKRSLPPMRGWAGSPDMLLAVAEWAIDTKPSVIVECSSGVSTLVAARCCQLNGHGHVYSLEHDADFVERTCQHLQRHGLQDWATVILAPLMQGGDGEKWYDDARLPSKLAAIDMLVIDGPPGGGDSTARYPAFPRLRNRLSPNAVIVLDDADRPGERAIVNRWIQLEPNLRRTYLPAEKGLVFLKLEEKCVA